jgi:hypothetical protein
MSDHDERQGHASAAAQEQGDGLAAMQGQGDAPASMRGTDISEVAIAGLGLGKFRRDGVPCAGLVNRKGDLWTLASPKEITRPWEELFLLRLRRLNTLGLTQDSVMPEDARKAVWNELVSWWERTPFGRQRWEDIRSTFWTSEEISRNWRSAVKAAMFTLFGGQVWVRLAIALGPVDNDMVRILNDIIAEKIRTNESRGPQETPFTGPRCRPRELDPSLPMGVQHKVSEAKRARADAKWWAKRLATETKRWERYRSKLTWHQWDKLKQKAEALSLNHVRCRCHYCHAPAMLLPGHALAMLLPCSCHALALLWPCSCHALAMLLPCNCHCHALAVLYAMLLPSSCFHPYSSVPVNKI